MDKLQRADRLGGGLGVTQHFFGVGFFLLGDLPNGRALVVQSLDALVEHGQLLPHPDDLQQGVGLVAVAGIHKAGQVQRQYLDELVQQLLAGAATGGVGDGQGAVFAPALHHNAVGQGHF